MPSVATREATVIAIVFTVELTLELTVLLPAKAFNAMGMMKAKQRKAMTIIMTEAGDIPI